MDSDRLNRWLALGANIGVILGLILLVYEIRQTNHALDREYDVFGTEVQGRARERWAEFNGRIIESDEVADIWIRGNAGAELSINEAERYRYLATDFILLYQLQYVQYEIVGRDMDFYSNWLRSGFENRPGLQKPLKRVVDRDPDSSFSKTVHQMFPDLQ